MGSGRCQRRICVCTGASLSLGTVCIRFSKGRSGHLALEAMRSREGWELSFIPKLGMSPA